MSETPEAKIARLEEQFKSVGEKAGVLFKKIEELTQKIEELLFKFSRLEADHAACLLRRGQTEGWIKGRLTRVFDASLAAVLLLLLILLLKNAGFLLPLVAKVGG